MNSWQHQTTPKEEKGQQHEGNGTVDGYTCCESSAFTTPQDQVISTPRDQDVVSIRRPMGDNGINDDDDDEAKRWEVAFVGLPTVRQKSYKQRQQQQQQEARRIQGLLPGAPALPDTPELRERASMPAPARGGTAAAAASYRSPSSCWFIPHPLPQRTPEETSTVVDSVAAMAVQTPMVMRQEVSVLSAPAAIRPAAATATQLPMSDLRQQQLQQQQHAALLPTQRSSAPPFAGSRSGFGVRRSGVEFLPIQMMRDQDDISAERRRPPPLLQEDVAEGEDEGRMPSLTPRSEQTTPDSEMDSRKRSPDQFPWLDLDDEPSEEEEAAPPSTRIAPKGRSTRYA